MKNRIFINFLLFFSVACFLHADAQYMLITHFSGSAAYGSYNVTVTSGGSVTTGGSSCLPAPTAYWIAPSSSIGWYTYTFSAPVSSVQVHVDGMNGGTYGAGDILKVFINGAPYVITPADITSYTGCGGPGGPCYLLGGYLYGPVGTTLVYTGADMTITYCGGINSIELYTDHSTSGMDYHIGIDTSVVGAALVGAITGPSVVCIGSTITLSDTSSGGTWASSTPSVATVSAGVVTGISAGIDTIKYTVTSTKTIYKAR